MVAGLTGGYGWILCWEDLLGHSIRSSVHQLCRNFGIFRGESDALPTKDQTKERLPTFGTTGHWPSVPENDLEAMVVG